MTKRLKPAFITEIAGLGGGETSLLNLLQAMGSVGHDPILVCPEGAFADRARSLDLSTHCMKLPSVHRCMGIIPMFSFSTVFQLYRLIKRENINIVHAESLLGLYYGGLAAFLAGIPCVSTYHGYWNLTVSLTRYFIKWFCRQIYPVSPSVASDLKGLFKYPDKRIQVIPLGIGFEFFHELPVTGGVRTQLNLPPDTFVIMQVARIQAVKGHLYLIEALKCVLQQTNGLRPVHLVLVGDVMTPPTLSDLEYKIILQHQVQANGLADHVTFLGHRDDVPQLMRDADVLVNPSESETFGMVIVEAMALGIPIIATDVGGPADILKHKWTGLLVPPKDPRAIASSIMYLLSDVQTAKQIAARAQQEAMKKYAPAVRYEVLHDNYLQLLGASK